MIHRGDRVRIERDEIRYPSKGTWPTFRGRVGTVVDVNLGEFGVVFGKVSRRTDGRGRFSHGDVVTWFLPHELQPISEPAGEGTETAERRRDDSRG